MTETLKAFPDPYILAIVTDTGSKRPKTDTKMTYLKKKNTSDSIRQKLRKRDKYDTNMYKMYNLVVGKTNEKP